MAFVHLPALGFASYCCCAPREVARSRKIPRHLYSLSESCRTGQCEELLWATEGWEQRPGVHSLQMGSVKIGVSSHWNFYSTSHLARFTLKYLTGGRQDCCRHLIGVSKWELLTGRDFRKLLLPLVLLHWPLRDQKEKQEHKAEIPTPFHTNSDLMHEKTNQEPFLVGPGKAFLLTLSLIISS